MRRGAGVIFLLWAAMALSLPASAQGADVWFYQGGEPGVLVSIEGQDVRNASSAGEAIPIDPSAPLRLSISIAPPPGETWKVRALTVGILLRGPDTPPPESLLRRVNATATLPPGFTVVLNRTIDLGPVAKLGAGTFLMQAEVLDESGGRLFVQTFYVKVTATVASLLTVQGATVSVITAATGYGLWSVAKDAKEARDAWARHRKKAAMAKLDVIGKTEHAFEDTIAKAGKPLASVVSLHRAAQERERGLGPIRWAATGLGLGGVAMAWLQFLGYLALDATSMIITAAEVCAAFLTIALIVNALVKRKPKAQTSTDGSAALEPMVSVPVQEGSTPAQVDVSEAAAATRSGRGPQDASSVQPADKRG